MDRYETVEWNTFMLNSEVTLGELRRVLREVSDWPDGSLVGCKGVTIRRMLPLSEPADL